MRSPKSPIYVGLLWSLTALLTLFGVILLAVTIFAVANGMPFTLDARNISVSGFLALGLAIAVSPVSGVKPWQRNLALAGITLFLIL